MHEAYVNITEIPTHIMTWGKWIEESWNNNEKELIICITGNPGLPGFYTKFISTMHDDLGQEIPCWIIGKFIKSFIKRLNNFFFIIM